MQLFELPPQLGIPELLTTEALMRMTIVSVTMRGKMCHRMQMGTKVRDISRKD
jgi:hypothetical protein